MEKSIEGFFQALSGGKIDSVADALAEDVVLEFPGRRFGARVEGRRRVVVFLKQNQRLFRGGLHFEIVWVGASGDRVVAQWRNRGVTRDGKGYSNRGVTIFRLGEGKIVEIQDYLDTEKIAETWPR